MLSISINTFSQTNRAIDFDGVDDWVEIPETASLDFQDELTNME